MGDEAVDISVSEAGDVPSKPPDGELVAVTVEDGGGHPRGYLIKWKHLENGWLYADGPDSWVSLDNSV